MARGAIIFGCFAAACSGGAGTIQLGDAGPIDSANAQLENDTSLETAPGVEDSSVEDTGPEDTAEAPPKVFAHLPVIRIESVGAITDDRKASATIQVIEDHDGTLDNLDLAPLAYEGALGIEVHGSSSTGYPKLGYRIECRDDAGDDTDCALVGLNEGHDYVLHAPYSDKSYMRNAVAYQLGRAVAETRSAYEVGSQHVELYLNGDYQGIYLLIERVERENDRLDIPPTTDPESGEVNGGFIVKIDQHRSDGFDTDQGTLVDWAEPKASEVTPAEYRYIKGWFDSVESVMSSDSFDDPTVGYAAWIDVDGFIDHWLVNELTHNIDAYRLSAYLWTDGPPGTSLLHAGPLWDFDRAFGNVNYCGCWETFGWIIDDLDACGEGYQFPTWWRRLEEDPAYVEARSARWRELRAGVLSDASISASIAAFYTSLGEAEPRDQAVWRTMGRYVDPNYYVGETWEDEISWLESWTLERAAWMDRQLRE